MRAIPILLVLSACPGPEPASRIPKKPNEELVVGDFGVDGHQATSARGSLKTVFSSVTRTSSMATV